MTLLLQDIRYALRMLRKSPGFTAVVVLTLALGIGLNTTVFTLANAVLFRGLPFDGADRIMAMRNGDPKQPRRNEGFSFAELAELRAQAKSLAGVAGYSVFTANVADGAKLPERLVGARMSANGFQLIGQRPIVGRDFSAEDERQGAPPVAIISHSAWTSRYGADPAVVGRVVRVNEVATTIVGVMAEDMKFPHNGDLWIPLQPRKGEEKRSSRPLETFARITDQTTPEHANAELAMLSEAYAKSYPDTNKNLRMRAETFAERDNGGEIRLLFLVLLGAVGFVLLIACANVANLMLARALSRVREMSIRSALGAGRGRILRQLLTECVMLSTLGGIAGLGIAWYGIRAFDAATANVGRPFWIQFAMDPAVFAYLAALCIGAGLLFGLVPSLQLARMDLNEALKESGRANSGSRRMHWFSGSLVVLQCAMALVLLMGAAVMMRSFLNMQQLRNGFDTEHIEIARIMLPETKYATPEARRQFERQLTGRLAAMPGVVSAAIASNAPLGGAMRRPYEIEGRPPAADAVVPDLTRVVVANAEYFPTLRAKPLAGRLYHEQDRDVVVINKSFAERHWKGENPLGKRLRFTGDNKGPWLTVIGVSPEILHTAGGREERNDIVYVPYAQDAIAAYGIILNTSVPPATLAEPMRREVQALDANLPLYNVMTFDEHLARIRWPYRVFGTLFAVFAAAALLLASIGLYGVMAYAVNQRRAEIGVRIALGAASADVLKLVLRRGVVQVGLGLLIGMPAAFALSQLITSILFRTSPGDPLTLAGIAVVLLLSGALACALPARRALRVDPMVALRYD